MFDEFLSNCPMEDEIKPSKRRVKNNIAALNSLIEKNESLMTNRRFRFKPLIIAAVITAFSMVSILTVNAATQGAVVRFFMGDKEIKGEFYDYVDKDGFRRVSFGAVLPINEENFAIIYDVDAPQGENVRVITEETDPDFFEKLRLHREANDKAWMDAVNASEQNRSGNPVHPEPEDFGLVFKDSEFCSFHMGYIAGSNVRFYGGTFGGKFMNMGAAKDKPSGFGSKNEPNECSRDPENGTKTYKETFYYYVGKE